MDFIKNNIVTEIIVALSLSALYFIWNKSFFKVPNLNGEWAAKIKVRESTYKPHIGLTGDFKIHVIQDNLAVRGTGEKIKNSNHNAPDTIYERTKRPLVQFEGYYERNYLGKSKLYLNIVENGRQRQTRASYHLTIRSKDYFDGYFESTAGDSKGEVVLTRSKAYFK